MSDFITAEKNHTGWVTLRRKLNITVAMLANLFNMFGNVS